MGATIEREEGNLRVLKITGLLRKSELDAALATEARQWGVTTRVKVLAVKRFAEPVASRLYPLVKKTTDITTMVMLAAMAIVYGKDFIGAIGSYAIGTLVLFVGVVTLATDRLGFGLKQGQRSVLTIGMCTRNLGAAIAPLMTIKADSHSVVMVALGIPVTLIFAFLAARWYASHAPQDEPAER
jgi:BASS family bile acid:Na+ symporter